MDLGALIFSVISRTLCRDAINIFYSPSRLGWNQCVYISFFSLWTELLLHFFKIKFYWPQILKSLWKCNFYFSLEYIIMTITIFKCFIRKRSDLKGENLSLSLSHAHTHTHTHTHTCKLLYDVFFTDLAFDNLFHIICDFQISNHNIVLVLSYLS